MSTLAQLTKGPEGRWLMCLAFPAFPLSPTQKYALPFLLRHLLQQHACLPLLTLAPTMSELIKHHGCHNARLNEVFKTCPFNRFVCVSFAAASLWIQLVLVHAQPALGLCLCSVLCLIPPSFINHPSAYLYQWQV